MRSLIVALILAYFFVATAAQAALRRSLYFEYTLSDQASVYRANDIYGQFTFENGYSIGLSGQKTKFFTEENYEETGGGVMLRNSPMSDWVFTLQSNQVKAKDDYSKANTNVFVGYNFDYALLQLGYGVGQHKFLTVFNNEKTLSHKEFYGLLEVYYSAFSFFVSRTNLSYNQTDQDNIISPLLTDPSSLEYSGLANSVTVVGVSYYVQRSTLEISRVQTASDEQDPTNTWKFRASTELHPSVRASLSLDDQKLVSLSIGFKFQL